MKEQLETLIQSGLEALIGTTKIVFTVEHPKDMTHGDYATNVALVVAKQLDKNPKEIAEALVAYFNEHKTADIASINIAGPGFINFTLSRNIFAKVVQQVLEEKGKWGTNSVQRGKKIMVEYTDPNPFKPFHIGHLMTNAIGESIARLLEFAGAQVIRANYQGDVGLHVAKAFYGMQKKGMPENMEAPAAVLAQYIGDAYVIGSEAYEIDPTAKTQINSLNQKIYDRTDAEVNEVYDWGRQVTLAAFEEIYKTLGTKFDYYFFESDMATKGKELVKEWLVKNVFEESDGAIVFRAEKYNPKLHTRVFITSQGLPTYEAKEIGLTKTKFEKEPDLDESLVVTAVEQKDYMAVATEALRHMDAGLAERMRHITHGMMRFADGKMSSRTGNVITGESLLIDTIAVVETKIQEHIAVDADKNTIARIVAVGAIKFAILRQSIGKDIVYDQEKAISFEGDSGPYLQYTAVRAGSLLEKGNAQGIKPEITNSVSGTEILERLIARFSEIVAIAQIEWAPHHLVTYLLEVAQAFNSWYGQGKIIDEDIAATSYRLAIVAAARQTIINGLWLLGIEVPERM